MACLFLLTWAAALCIGLGLVMPFFWESVPENVKPKHDFVIYPLEEASRPSELSRRPWSKHIRVQLCPKERPALFNDDPSELTTLERSPHPLYIFDPVGDEDLADIMDFGEVGAFFAK